jgi:pimeloyl-ACP methyl ester carboxylesterase
LGFDVHLPPSVDVAAAPVVLLVHGFKGFRRWGMFPHLAERLAQCGRVVVLPDLSHNGTEPGHEEDFTRLDLFERQTLSAHLADLAAVLDAHDAGELDGLPPREADQRDVHVVGHSLGGGLALLLAAADGRVASVAGLNSVGHFARIGPEGLAQLEREGRVDIPNARTGQLMHLGRPWFEDIARHDLRAACEGLTVPTLIVVGEADTSVPPDEGRQLARWIPGAQLVEVPGADHTFGAKHPWRGWTEPLRAACDALDAHLPRGTAP